MRCFIWLLISVVLSIPFSSASAEEIKLKASEIKELLTGNTALGTWNGTAYRQFFHKDGSTIYATKNNRSSLGQWGVNYTSDTYESLWNEARWDSYDVLRNGHELHWRDGDLRRYAFQILPGQQLLWPE